MSKTCVDCNKSCVGTRCRKCEGINRRGDRHYNYKGGERDHNGYVRLSGMHDHPNSDKIGRVFQHVVVMSNYLGRALYDWETVHHINNVKNDNRIENLQLRIGQHGQGALYSCSDCGSTRLEAKEI